MLVATRDHEPHTGGSQHFGPSPPPRTLVSRLTTGAQLVGSLVGIPLALAGGYSTYHANFSPEAKCQALRASIVSVLDKKTDASTLRLLVQRDVVTFERDCGAVDADAAAAFKTLLAADKTPAAHRPITAAKVEKVESVAAQPPAKVEKTEKAERREPVKREALKRDVPVKEAAKETVVREAVAEPPKQLGAPPQPLVAPPLTVEKVTATAPEADKTVEQSQPVEAVKPVEEPKPVETAAVQPEKTGVDATWVASVRDALRESASQPTAETTADVAAPMSAPMEIAPESQLAATPAKTGALVPPADVGPGGSRPSAPRPPGLIPNAN
jgi:hypothetical protein